MDNDKTGDDMMKDNSDDNANDENKDTDDIANDDNDDMVEDDKDGSEYKEQSENDARTKLEEAREGWYDKLILPLQLALEVTANLTSVMPQLEASMHSDTNDDGDNMMDLDDDIQWGAKEEAALMAGHGQHQGTSPQLLSSTDGALVESIVKVDIPSHLLSLMDRLCLIPLDESIPEEARDDLQDIPSKCGTCLVNSLGECFSISTDNVFAVLRSSLEASQSNKNVAAAMAVALRSKSDYRRQVKPTNVDYLLNCASMSKTIQCEAIEMLGLLCSKEEHPEGINRKVGTVLTGLTSKNASVQHEALDSLMDIYGDEEKHPSVFKDLNVLGHFQKTLPGLKQSIQADRVDTPREEVERWKETALNASRFIQYCKGQL